MAGQISVSLEGEIATVTISQPGKRNALTVEMWGELKSAFEKAGADATLRCIVLRGDGDEAFSAGADMSEVERVLSTPGAGDRVSRELRPRRADRDHGMPGSGGSGDLRRLHGRRPGNRRRLRPANRR